jgi:predicted ATPase
MSAQATGRDSAGRHVPLDPALLRSGFQAQTAWHVLTGAACTGKTTLIEQLAALGYAVVPESARYYFDHALAAGRTLADIHADDRRLQREIATLQIAFEQRAATDRITFLDRALPDSLAFYRLVGLDPNEILPECFRHRYASVFVLDRLPTHRTRTLGPEDDASSTFLDQWLERDYRALGYEVVRVPPLPPRERVELILDRLGRPPD